MRKINESYRKQQKQVEHMSGAATDGNKCFKRCCQQQTIQIEISRDIFGLIFSSAFFFSSDCNSQHSTYRKYYDENNQHVHVHQQAVCLAFNKLD